MARVEIYTKNFCGFCIAAKRLLQSKGVDFQEINIGFSAAKRREMIRRANGGQTVPQIFIDGRHIGGCDDLYALDRAGGLDPLLAG